MVATPAQIAQDGAFSGAVAGPLSGAPSNTTSASYTPIVTNALAYATEFTTALAGAGGAGSSSSTGLLALGISLGLWNARGTVPTQTPTFTQLANVASAIYIAAKGSLQA